MRLLADVHVKSSYVTALRSDGHDVSRVVDVLDGTAADSAVVEHARETNRAVVTNDAKDFTRFADHPGVLVVPRTGLTPGEVAASVSRIERLVPDTNGLSLYVSEWL
jgi:predicted nuclease of predicted toxin-antitoxin system